MNYLRIKINSMKMPPSKDIRPSRRKPRSKPTHGGTGAYPNVVPHYEERSRNRNL